MSCIKKTVLKIKNHLAKEALQTKGEISVKK